ncbi:restriction endonuclease subunit S [Saccharopolyspora hirsuta]|uniref:restriction endonuclease subunit S n=1 Tax=Saccharopolyspora hirsuta TaxID=1837 RepID=UPI0033171788
MLINSTGTGTLGRVGFFTESLGGIPCVADSHVTVARAKRDDLDPRFCYYWLSSRTFYHYMYEALVVGSTNQIELNRERLAYAPVPLPPLEEQRRIADFLDAETSRIDRLVSYREAQVELLRKKFDSLLIHTVLPRCGQQGWRATRLKYLFDFVNGGVWGEEPVGDGSDVRCVRVADFDREGLRSDPEAPTERNVSVALAGRRILCPGDVLLEKSGGGEKNPVGFAVTFDSHRKSICSNFVAMMRPVRGVNPRYVALLMAGFYKAGMNTPFIKQTTGIQNLDVGAYLAQRVLLPENNEQAELAGFLDASLERFRSIRSRMGHQIELLSERRQALITAAVTGQIDVTTASGRGIEE